MAPIVTLVGPKTPHGKETSVADVMQNIKVFVRCRPLKANEKKNVIDMCVDRKEVRCNESKNSNERYNSKTFTFDNVFGIDTTQLQVYQSVVEPLIEQVVMGYNCTVFAYGQTGTGKTYTMEGERSVNDDLCSWEEDPIAGIIPRALHQLFETLHSEESEHTVRVSFLELYNEELYDLLSAIDDTTKLKIFEDVSRKGSIIVGGLEEITVHSKAEIYEILRKGSSKRQTAATLLNACSSRSHTIFSVTVHIKESAIDGEDLVKIGKLNLVDLAGSENIGRSGAIDKRAREAGNINQSLLTLGRVITSLVDRTPHIPYRESKLTRLLQESLGGRTKTSIIATISPNIADADDTLSTLEYAQRAKKITNKPEINQKMSKKTLLREYTAEIERLRRDLAACREKNGIYINEDNYHQMEQQIKEQTQEIEDKLSQIQALTEEMNKIQLLFDETKEELDSKLAELDVTNKNLKTTWKKLTETEHNLMSTQIDRNEQKHLVGEHLKTEELLSTQAKQLLNVAQVSTCDVGKLHNKVDRIKSLETTNWSKTNEFQQKFSNEMNRLEELVSITTTSYNDSLDEMQNAITEKIGCVEAVVSGAQNKLISLSKSMDEHKSRLSSILTKDRIVLEQSMILKDNNTKQYQTLGQTFDEIMAKVEESQNTMNAEISKITQIVGQQRQEMEAMAMKQNSHLKKMAKITVNSFNIIKTDFKTFIDTQNEEIASIVSQMESSTKANSESQQAIDQELDDIERVMKSQIERLNDIKVKRIKAKVESENSSSDLSNKFKSTANTRINCLNGFNGKVDGFVSEIDCEEKVGLNYIESIDNMNTENTQQMLNQTNELNVKNTELPNQTKQLISDRKEELIKRMTYSDKLFDDSIKLCDKQLNAKQTALKTLDDSLTEGLEAQKSSIADIVENMELISDCVTEKTSEMVRMSQTMEKSQIREIEDRYKSFDLFVRNDLIKDIPTGTTPQKTEYSYPRDLVQTSPHETILHRYRLNTNVNNAINTCLPEEYESEFLSDSSSSLKSFGSNDENIKPMTDSHKRKKAYLNSKVKPNASLKSISDSNQTFVAEKESLKRSVTPRPLTANQIN